MANRKISDVLWLALVCAKDDRQSLIDAYSGDTNEKAVRKAMSDINAFEKLQIKLFGTTKTKLDSMMEKMTSKSIFDILNEDI